MNDEDDNSLGSVESGKNVSKFPFKLPGPKALRQHTTPENLSQKLKLDKKTSLSDFLQTKKGMYLKSNIVILFFIVQNEVYHSLYVLIIPINFYNVILQLTSILWFTMMLCVMSVMMIILYRVSCTNVRFVMNTTFAHLAKMEVIDVRQTQIMR